MRRFGCGYPDPSGITRHRKRPGECSPPPWIMGCSTRACCARLVSYGPLAGPSLKQAGTSAVYHGFNDRVDDALNGRGEQDLFEWVLLLQRFRRV